MKTKYNVSLFKGSNSVAETIVVSAAKSNGGLLNLSLANLKTIGEADVLKWPQLNGETSIEVIGDNLLHVDCKLNGSYETVCVIELVEVAELSVTEIGELTE